MTPRGRESVGHDFDADVFEAGFADVAGEGRMSLEGEGSARFPDGAGGKFMFGVAVGNLVFDDGVAVEFDGYEPVLADNFLGVIEDQFAA